MTNPVWWFDIFVEDMNRAVSFYENVLDIKLEDMSDPSWETQMMSFPADMQKYGAGWALVKTQYAKPGAGGTQIYFSVQDCAIQQELLVQAWGKILRPKFSIGDFGFIVLWQDSEWNTIGFNSMV